MVKKATQTVDTDISVPAGTPQEKIDAYKALLRSNAYSILGTIEFKKDNFVGAQEDLQKVYRCLPERSGSRSRSPPGADSRQAAEVSGSA